MALFYGKYTHMHCTSVYEKASILDIYCFGNTFLMKHNVDFTLECESTLL